MYRVLIADDEYLICELIKKLIRWEDLGLELVGEAGDGETALKMIVALKPDIVITDICMPGIDGLSIVKAIRKKKLDTSVIIISGHKQFEYAINSIKYGVEDYLLKPINEDELNHRLKCICQRISDLNKRNQKSKKLEINFQENIIKLRARMIEDVLLKNISFKNFDEFNNQFQFSFKKKFLQVVVVKLDQKGIENFPLSKQHIVLNKIVDKIKDILENSNLSVEFSIFNGLLYCFLNFDDMLPKKEYKKAFESIKEVTNVYVQYFITMGIGRTTDDIHNLSEAIESARSAIFSRLALGVNRCIFFEDLNFNNIDEKVIYNDKIIWEFKNTIELLDREKMQDLVSKITNSIKEAEVSPEIKLNLFSKLLIEFFIAIGKDPNNSDKEDLDSYTKNIFEYYNLNDVVAFIKKTITQEYDIYFNNKHLKLTKPVRVAKSYIEAHYNENITLNLIAGMVYLNPVYFSIMFKKEEGTNFLEYLINIRVNKAKELLKDSTFSIAEVARKIGYKDTRYFTVLFKRITGITPKEFRKLQS